VVSCDKFFPGARGHVTAGSGVEKREGDLRARSWSESTVQGCRPPHPEGGFGYPVWLPRSFFSPKSLKSLM
jgi:hypothetical protein